MSAVAGYLTAFEPARLDQPTDPHDAGLILAAVVAHAALLVVLVMAIRRARSGSLVALSCLVGALALSWGEALYDEVFQLAFYTKDFELWSPFGISLPIWLPAGYVMAYGMGGWLVAERVLRGGVTRVAVARMFAVTWLGCFAFETFAYQVGAFEYYEHSITVFGTPLWVETFNAVFIVIAGLLIGSAQPVLGPAAQFGVTTLIYLGTFCGVTYGAGFVALNILNAPESDTAWFWLAVAVSQVVALAMLWAVVDFVALLPRHRASLGPGPRLVKLRPPAAEPDPSLHPIPDNPMR